MIKRVEKTHKNLGLPVIFTKLIDLANMGCFLVGPRGVGKGAVLKCLEELRHRDVLEISRLTPAGLAKEAGKMSDRELTLVNLDFSTFYTDYLKDAGINLVSHLLTERRVPASWTAQYKYSIENCTVSFISAMQPQLLRRVNNLPQWESMYRDRFIRFIMIYPFGEPKWQPFYPEVPELEFELKDPEEVTVPKSIKRLEEYVRLKAAVWRQTSEGRAEMFTDRLLKAHAYLNNRHTVTESDVKMMSLFMPYLILDFLLSSREAVSAPLRFNPDAYLVLFYLIMKGEATRKDLKDYFMLQMEKGSDALITRATEPLKARNLIEGVYGTPTYRINKEWDEKYLKPIREWAKEVGVTWIS